MKNTYALFLSAILCTSLFGYDNHLTNENSMESYKVVERPSMIVMGIACRTSNSPAYGPYDIPRHWAKFYQDGIFDQIPHKASKDIIALYCDYEGDYTKPYTLVIGCQVTSLDEIPTGMVAKTIPAGKFAVFHAAGEQPKAVIELWNKIWHQQDLKRAYTFDYEVYGEKFVSPNKEVDVFIAIK